jgi:hypothetical protein
MNGGKEERKYVISGMPKGNIPLGRTRYRCVEIDEVDDLGERGWGVVDWIGLAQDRDRWRALVKAVIKLRIRVL